MSRLDVHYCELVDVFVLLYVGVPLFAWEQGLEKKLRLDDDWTFVVNRLNKQGRNVGLPCLILTSLAKRPRCGCTSTM